MNETKTPVSLEQANPRSQTDISYDNKKPSPPKKKRCCLCIIISIIFIIIILAVSFFLFFFFSIMPADNSEKTNNKIKATYQAKF